MVRRFVLALAILPLACSNKTDTNNAADTGTTPQGVETFTPQGCGYTVARPTISTEFPLLDPHADVVSPTAKVQYVFRGLGGDVKTGDKSYADPSTSFAIGWQTDAATTASRIRYGESPDKLDKQVDGFSYVVPQEGGVGPEDGVRFHEVHVCGLAPGRTYSYQVGGGPAGKEVWSAVMTTTTAPAPGSDTIKLGLVGDTRDALGTSTLPVWKAIAGRYKASATPIVLFSGDMVLVSINQNMWDTWSSAAADASPSVFFALAPGNHENEQLRFFAHAVMPGTNGQNAKRYASFDWGPVHVVMLDSYPGLVQPKIDDTNYRAEVLAWLEQDLTKAESNRAKVPWIVTFHHHPLYSDTTMTDRAVESQNMRDALLSIYEKHKVDLDVAGHDHFYERFQPLLAGASDPKGVTYLIDGAAGAPAYSIKPDHPLAAKVQTYDPASEGIYGIATVSATSFKATFRKLASTAPGSPDGDAIVDEFELTKR